LTDVKTLLSDFQSNSLKDLHGYSPLAQENGVFAYLEADITGFNGLNGQDFLGLVPKPGANPTSFSLNIRQLAQQDSVIHTVNGVTSTTTDILDWAGTLTFPHLDGVSPDIAITVTAGSNLQTIIASVNEYTNSTGVYAEAVPITTDPGTPSASTRYHLSFNSTQFAKPVTFVSTVTGTNVGIPTSSTKTESELSAIVVAN
jgi:hypothetical protein